LAGTIEKGKIFMDQKSQTLPVRIQLSRARGWRMPPNTLIVARPRAYGNPIHVGALLKVELGGGMYEAEVTQAIAVELYREYIKGALRSHPRLLEPLRGKNLACWCPLNEPCHADVLLEIANR